MPGVTERELSGENLNTQYYEREDISLLRARWLSIPSLAWWVDKPGASHLEIPTAPGVAVISTGVRSVVDERKLEVQPVDAVERQKVLVRERLPHGRLPKDP